MKSKRIICWMIFCLSGPLYADAWTKTENQLEIDAVRVDHREQEHRTIYQHKVIMRQKDRKLLADTLILQREPLQDRHLEAYGQPVYFEFPDKQARLVKAQAETLYYYPQTQQLILEGKAQIKHEQTEIRANHLIYKLENQELLARPKAHARLEIKLDNL